MSRGFTLIELALVLTLAATAVAVVAPGVGRLRDLSAVLAAREALIGLIAEGRAHAVGRGRTRVLVESVPPRAVVIRGADTLRTLRFTDADAVVLDLGRRARVEVEFDARGVGRASSATVLVRRATAERGIVVSAFGRVRRR